MEFAVYVVPGVYRDLRLGNVVHAAAMSAPLHLLNFHDTDGYAPVRNPIPSVMLWRAQGTQLE